MKIGLFSHPDKVEAKKVVDRLVELAAARRIEVVSSDEEQLDVVVAIGGDGTILRAAHLAHSRRVPLLGVNAGRLGFLSSLGADSIEVALDDLASGAFIVEERMMIKATWDSEVVALNEVVVERAKPSRVIRVAVSVDSEEVSTYSADGFIVATPTGSTAYSLSAGGPVLEPDLEALVLTPVSAHSPLWRSIVLRRDRVVELEVVEGTAVISSDGDPKATIAAGGKVKVSNHPWPLQLLRPDFTRTVGGGPGFFRKLRTRFNLDIQEQSGWPK